MGVQVDDERPYKITPAGRTPSGSTTSVYARRSATSCDTSRYSEIFQDTFLAVWRGDVEDDGFNRLVLRARPDVARGHGPARVRASICARRRPRSARRTWRRRWPRNPRITRLLGGALRRPLRPGGRADADARPDELGRRSPTLDAVASLDEDRILRTLPERRRHAAHELVPGRRRRRAPAVPLVQARPGAVPDLPLPRPMFEIFVYSPRIEGVHLRGGEVARGGIRWSDRRGLPHRGARADEGADGEERRDRPGRRQGRLRGQAAAARRPRRAARRGGRVLPDLHLRPARPHRQHRRAASVVPPAATSCATTATIRTSSSRPTRARRRSRDIANGIAAEYGFWLGDAFASGGSDGYDHKEMGITARGAWESVKRHFRELGIDIADHGLHRRRHRRHVRRRVRQRHAAVART